MPNYTKYFDLNVLLKWSNVFLCFLGVLMYIIAGGNRYIDANTIFLFCMLCVEDLIFLSYEKRNRDPFILILTVFVTVFYAARIVTLLHAPYSVVLNRNTNFSSFDMNHVLLFIISANVAIFFGIICARGRFIRRQDVHLEDQKQLHPSRVVGLLLAGIIVTFFGVFPESIFGRLSFYAVVIFFNIWIILLFAFVYLMLNYENISKLYKWGIICLLIIFVIAHTLIGSRQSLFVLMILFIIAFLAVRGSIKLHFKVILTAVLFIPITVILFISATYIRAMERNPTVVSLDRFNLVMGARNDIFSSDKINIAKQRIFDRMGYLDYSADAIMNRDKWERIVSFDYYFKSIIDNCLTPGFDVFDAPRVAHAMRCITLNIPEPTHDDTRRAYNSDMITLYGDYYILFNGYLALIIFFAIAFLLKAAFNLTKSNIVLFYYLKRAIVIYIFYLWLTDFGIDWMVFDLIKIAIMYILLMIFDEIGGKKFVYRLP